MWTVVPNGKEVKLLEKIKAKNLQSWWKAHTQMQEAWQSLSTKNMRGTTPRHIIIRLLKNSDNKKTLKSIKRKNTWSHKKWAISHYRQSKQEDSGVTSLSTGRKRKICSPRNLHPAKKGIFPKPRLHKDCLKHTKWKNLSLAELHYRKY